MNDHTSNRHLSAEQLQALLEGEVPTRDFVQAEKHLTGCARCSAELDGWKTLFEDLGDLTAHRPLEGFAERVMAGVQIPESVPLAARVKTQLNRATSAKHLSTEVLQDFVEGTLAARRAARVERHLESCPPCTADADVWIALFGRLGELESLTPSPGFGDRVMAEISTTVSLPLGARIRGRISALFGAPPEHMQDFVDGLLPARAMARVEAHVGDCRACGAELSEWQHVAARLDTLGHLSPAEGFEDQAMTGYLAARSKRAVVRQPVWSRAVSTAWRLVPQTREAWAALSGVAVTPAVVVGLVFYAVFSHPTLTIGSLVSFAWWQVSDVLTAAMAGLSAAAFQGMQGVGGNAILEALASAPTMVAGAALAYSMVCAVALRVLYKNLLMNRHSQGRYAHVSAAS